MKRFAVLFSLSLLASLSACARLGLSKPSTSGVPAAPKIAAPTEPPAAGLSEYATRFIRDTNALAETCPAGPTPAPSYESECVWRIDAAERLHKSVEEKVHPQVKRGFAYLVEVRKSLVAWRAAAADKEERKVADYRTDQEIRQAANKAEGLIRDLKTARDGKVDPITTPDHRDADYVEQTITFHRKYMPELEPIAAACAKGAGDKELCDIAVNREKYFTLFMALQFDAILAQQLKAWADEVTFMKNEGRASVVQYNTLTKPEQLKELAGDLAAIGKELSQPNPAAKIDGKLAKIREDLLAAVREKQTTNAWKLHASAATYQDPEITKAVREIKGLSMVRVGSPSPTWGVIRGALDQPIKRERGIWTLMKKPGETFCRLYYFTVVEDHLGGGKYGSGRAESFGEVLFYVSTCK